MAAASGHLGGSVRATIAAPPETLWAIVADPTRHPDLAGSGEPHGTHLLTDGPVGVGSRFESRQIVRGIVRYTARAAVTAYDPPRRFQWKLDDVPPYPPGSFDLVWEFQLEPVTAGSRVTHRYRWGIAVPKWLEITLVPLRRWRDGQNVGFMVATLHNLARLVGAPTPSGIQVSRQAPRLR
jgi:uncharacterized protein YndB with AHSA1/START domain